MAKEKRKECGQSQTDFVYILAFLLSSIVTLRSPHHSEPQILRGLRVSWSTKLNNAHDRVFCTVQMRNSHEVS